MSGPKEPNLPSKGQFLVYQTEAGQVKIDVRLEGETAWLTQAHMAELFQTTVPNVSMHLRNVYAEGELQAAATVKEFLIVRQEGNRRVSRAVEHYNLDAIIFADAPGRARRIIQHGDVLWSCVRPNRRSHAQVMHPKPNTIASTGFAVLTARKVPFTFLYFATTTDDFVAYLTNNATGAAYPAVSAATFEKANLLIPPAPLLNKFGDATIPTAEQIHMLQRQIQNLRRTRDLLLPRLLRGQVRIVARHEA